ncbi:transcriptional regulator [Neorhizobium petrolearium]|uniref:transcriptional regulator n=1 Tax=Neorhizobium petrolearium TaxID=515361 RepID=UPI003F7E91DE
MIRGPQPGRTAADPIEKAVAAWGGDLPAWVLELAEACRLSNQSAIAKRLGYSPAVVSSILSNTYKGDVARVEQMVRGALMAETVPCPALGDIPRNICLDWQAKPYAATSSHRAAMYHACRNNCPFSRLAGSNLSGEDE